MIDTILYSYIKQKLKLYFIFSINIIKENKIV